MSIGLIVRSPASLAAEWSYLPVATEEVFRQQWRPAAFAVGADDIAHLDGGLPLDKEMARLLVPQLERLGEYFRQSERAALVGILERIALLLTVMRELATSTESVDAFIG